jgi:hypothetical protein
VKYFIEKVGSNGEICLKEPLYENESDGIYDAEGKTWNSSLALLIAASNYDMPMLEYIWNELYYLWELEDLDRLVDFLYN